LNSGTTGPLFQWPPAIFTHAVDGTASFRFFTSQLITNGTASQTQVVRAFAVPLITVKRMCKKLREQGAAAFYRPPEPMKGHKLTPELIAKAQALIDEGRERLCLRATTDDWVNALDGQPFFCVTKAIDPGLQKTIREDLVPRLLVKVPGQPSEAQLAANPLLPRFTLVFDREGYSPELFAWLWTEHRIAILTYHKHPGPDWDASKFSPLQLTLVNGEEVTLQLAERGTRLTNGFWLREVRKLNESGHQTSILSTRYLGPIEPLAAAMFARWHQETFGRRPQPHSRPHPHPRQPPS